MRAWTFRHISLKWPVLLLSSQCSPMYLAVILPGTLPSNGQCDASKTSTFSVESWEATGMSSMMCTTRPPYKSTLGCRHTLVTMLIYRHQATLTAGQ